MTIVISSGLNLTRYLQSQKLIAISFRFRPRTENTVFVKKNYQTERFAANLFCFSWYMSHPNA